MNSSLPPPPPTRAEAVTEAHHGVEIVDRYRWLEDGTSDEVKAWVDAQNQYTEHVLGSQPGRDRLRQRLEQALSVGLIGAPRLCGARVFFVRRDGSQNQPVLYLRSTLDAPARVLVDPNVLSADGTIALDWWFPSLDGRLLAYGLSAAGDEKSTLYVLDVDSGERRPDNNPHTRYSSLAWLADASGFFYSRYPAPGTVPPGEENYNQRIFLHRLGDDPGNDTLVFGEGRHPEDMYDLGISPDGRWLLVHAFQGWAKNDLYLLATHDLETAVPIVEGEAALFVGKVFDDQLYILTNQDAPRFQLCKTPVTQPQPNQWRTVVPEGDHVLESMHLIGGKLLLTYLRNAASHIVVASTEGQIEREVELPTLGTIQEVAGEQEQDTALWTFVSFFVPPALYRYDMASGQLALYDHIETPIDVAQFAVRQVWYLSKDGTPISMFVMHRRDLALSGDHPTLLTGYGGFNVSMTPYFWRSLPVWLERGGVAALPNLRGGAEYGEAWHQSGMLANKQNVFDDFIAAAEWLIEQGYTNRQKLAIMGGSNGGLLVGAAMTQRPDLFQAVVCRVPLLHMLRYHHFLIARLWIPEYGSAEDPEQFRWLYAYSPYHNVKSGTAYPAVLLTTAESDSRVDPLHARKMAALLQANATVDTRPVLLRIETRAGHGAGKPLTKLIDEETDIWSFIGWQVGVQW